MRIDRGASLPTTSTTSNTSQPGNDIHLTVVGGTTLTASGSTVPLITSSTMATTMKNTKTNKVGSVNLDGKVKWHVSEEGDDNTSIADEKSNDNSSSSTSATIVSESMLQPVTMTIKTFPFRPNLQWRPGSSGTLLENIVAAVYESHPILSTLLELPGLVLDSNSVLTSTCEQLVIKVSHSNPNPNPKCSSRLLLSLLLYLELDDGHLPHTQSSSTP